MPAASTDLAQERWQVRHAQMGSVVHLGLGQCRDVQLCGRVAGQPLPNHGVAEQLVQLRVVRLGDSHRLAPLDLHQRPLPSTLEAQGLEYVPVAIDGTKGILGCRTGCQAVGAQGSIPWATSARASTLATLASSRLTAG